VTSINTNIPARVQKKRLWSVTAPHLRSKAKSR